MGRRLSLSWPTHLAVIISHTNRQHKSNLFPQNSNLKATAPKLCATQLIPNATQTHSRPQPITHALDQFHFIPSISLVAPSSSSSSSSALTRTAPCAHLPAVSRSHLVGPLSHSYAAAGFFPRSDDRDRRLSSAPMTPGELEGGAHVGLADIASESRQIKRAIGQSTNGLDGDTSSVYSQTRYWLIEDPPKLSPDGQSAAPKLNRQFVTCTQTRNLRDNFLYWDAKSKERQQSLTLPTTSAPPTTTTTTPAAPITLSTGNVSADDNNNQSNAQTSTLGKRDTANQGREDCDKTS